MLDDIYSSFHSGNYVQGINIFVDDFVGYYKSGIPSEMKDYVVTEDGYLKKVYTTPWGFVILTSTLITAIIMIILVKKNKMVKSKLKTSDYINYDDIHITNAKSTLINSYITSHSRDTSSYSGGGGGGFSSHSGSSGGGHSSGGGRHG